MQSILSTLALNPPPWIAAALLPLFRHASISTNAQPEPCSRLLNCALSLTVGLASLFPKRTQDPTQTGLWGTRNRGFSYTLIL
jgi:hypothetical protein